MKGLVDVGMCIIQHRRDPSPFFVSVLIIKLTAVFSAGFYIWNQKAVYTAEQFAGL